MALNTGIATAAPDNRCTYRVVIRTDEEGTKRYYPQYRYQGGWWWHTIEHRTFFDGTVKYTLDGDKAERWCEDHAQEYLRRMKIDRETKVINLGKLP